MNRRTLLAGVGATALPKGIPHGGDNLPAGQVMPHPDAALIAACERYPDLLLAWNRELSSTDDEAIWNGEGPAGIAYYAARDLIAAAEAQTFAGVVAKARAARCDATMEDGSVEPQCFTSDASRFAWDAMNDLLRLAGDGA